MRKRIIFLWMCLCTSVIFGQNYKFGKVSKEELEEKVTELDSTANASYLLKNKKVYFEYDGSLGWSLITDVHERIKIYSKDGVDYAEKVIRLYNNSSKSEKVSSLKAYTYNLEGSKIVKTKLSKKQVFKEKVTDNWEMQKFTMPNLKEGSVVEWSYKIRSPFYSNIDEAYLQHGVPIKKLQYTVKIPEYFVFKMNYKGYLQMYFKNSFKNRTISYSYRTNGDPTQAGGVTTRYNEKVDLRENIYSIDEDNVPGLPDDEPFVANIYNYRRGAKFELTMTKFPNSMPKYYTTTWADVGKRIYKTSVFGAELKKTNYFKDDLAAILVNANTPSKKIMNIFNHVKKKVKWNKVYGKYVSKGVKKAYKEGVGNVADINLMLTSMLREAGLDANPVLVSTKDNGIPLFPTLEGFNYVIASVNIQGKNILLDATDRYSLPNILPLRAINWKGRIVKDNLSSDWVELMPTKFSETTNFMSVVLDNELSIKGMLRTTLKNHEAISFRKTKGSKKEEDLINNFEEKYNIEVDNYKVNNKEQLYKPITRVVKFTGEEIAENIGDKVYISPLLFLKSTNNPFKIKERKFPVDFRIPMKHKSSVSIKIPEGYKVETMPESSAVALGNNAAVYGFKLMSNGNKITVISQFQINSPVITSNYYQELKELFNQMIKKQSEKIVLVKQ